MMMRTALLNNLIVTSLRSELPPHRKVAGLFFGASSSALRRCPQIRLKMGYRERSRLTPAPPVLTPAADIASPVLPQF